MYFKWKIVKISGVLYRLGKVLYIGVSIGDFTPGISELHL